MFQATDNLQYLDRALEYIVNVINDSRRSRKFPNSRHQDGYYGWVCKVRGKYYGKEVSLNETYMWRFVTRILRLMHANDAVWNDSYYRPIYERILEFSEVHIFDKWYSRGPQSHIYRGVAHIAAHFGHIALNLANLTADATRRARCMEVFDNINHSLPNFPGSSLRAQLIPHPTVPGGIFWDPWWGQFSRPGGDVSHAGGVVSFIVEAEELGEEWTRDDIDGLIATLNGAIWPASRLQPALYVDGTGRGIWGLNDGWIKLGRYSVTVQKLLEESQNGRGLQQWGNAALNARYLFGKSCPA